MKCDIYKPRRKKGWYLFIQAGASTEESLPSKLKTKLGDLEFFKTITFDEGSPLIAADPKEIIENINSKGYHIQGAKVISSVTTAGAAFGAGILGASIGGPIGAIIGAGIGAGTGLIAGRSAKGDKDDS